MKLAKLDAACFFFFVFLYICIYPSNSLMSYTFAKQRIFILIKCMFHASLIFVLAAMLGNKCVAFI